MRLFLKYIRINTWCFIIEYLLFALLQQYLGVLFANISSRSISGLVNYWGHSSSLYKRNINSFAFYVSLMLFNGVLSGYFINLIKSGLLINHTHCVLIIKLLVDLGFFIFNFIVSLYFRKGTKF